LFNPRSELVGINTAILEPSDGNIGIGFAIPINMLRHDTAELIEYGGEVRRGALEEIAQDLTRELAHPPAMERKQDAMIVRAEPDSPAVHAGLEPGDVVSQSVATLSRMNRYAQRRRSADGGKPRMRILRRLASIRWTH
jgi:S1-C subfamily serine protease